MGGHRRIHVEVIFDLRGGMDTRQRIKNWSEFLHAVNAVATADDRPRRIGKGQPGEAEARVKVLLVRPTQGLGPSGLGSGYQLRAIQGQQKLL